MGLSLLLKEKKRKGKEEKEKKREVKNEHGIDMRYNQIH